MKESSRRFRKYGGIRARLHPRIEAPGASPSGGSGDRKVPREHHARSRPLSAKTTEEIRTIAAERNCRILAIESKGAGRFSVLRLVLERSDGQGVTVENCEGVSREVSALLDATDEIEHRYTLEVSSAGLDRRLYSLSDAARFVGKRVRVKTEVPVEAVAAGSSRAAPGFAAKNLAGVLEAVSGDVLTIVDEENRKIYNVCFGNIALARLDFQWPERGRSEKVRE